MLIKGVGGFLGNNILGIRIVRRGDLVSGRGMDDFCLDVTLPA